MQPESSERLFINKKIQRIGVGCLVMVLSCGAGSELSEDLLQFIG